MSRAMICDTFATESFGSPVLRDRSATFPGAFAHRKLLVKGTQITVAMPLRLKASPCTTTTGRRNPGPDPVGAGRSAHQISPCEITTHFSQVCGERPLKRTRPSWISACRKPDSRLLLFRPARGVRGTPERRRYTTGSLIFSCVLRAVPRLRTHRLESKRPSSYFWYNTEPSMPWTPDPTSPPCGPGPCCFRRPSPATRCRAQIPTGS